MSKFIREPGAGGYALSVSTPEGFGWTFLEDNAVTIAEDLSSATIAPTTVVLIQCDERTETCTEVSTVTVAVTFQGTSQLIRFQNRFKEINGCRVAGSNKGIRREGVATITVDDQSYSAFGSLSRSTDTFRVQCRR